MCTAHDQREKALSFNYLHLKVSKELARKVGLGHKPCPGATVLVCYTRQGGQDIRGHRLTLVTRRAAFCVHYTHLQGWGGKVRWMDSVESMQWTDGYVIYYYYFSPQV